MTSQSLYRKWRSQKFGELVGQEPIIRTLKNALSSGKPAHAYLFTGPRGTGKTSTARLLAKTINCENPHDGEPCNQCQQCREITAGNSFNVIEIDAASNRGIDSIRDLREKVMMPPSTGKYKVYVLDEAHMLTTEAFNALLKTLEEPPNYAIFVLATTDVHKMLPTVLSRCQRFDFKRITPRQIVEHLNFVAEQEHITLERAAAELIARAAAGGMRDALSLLDQAIAYSGETVSLAQVQAMLGVADPQAIHKLVMHVANLNSSSGLHLIHELAVAGADLRQINVQVGEYWRALMLARAGADVTTILDLTEDESQEITQTAQLFGLEELTECARTFVQNELAQKNQGTPQLGLELAFLACVELHRRALADQTLDVVVQPRSAVPRSPTQPPARPVTRPSQSSIEDYVSASANEPNEASSRRGQLIASSADLSATNQPTKPPTGRETPTPTTAQNDATLPPLTVQQIKSAWEKVAKRVKQKSPPTAAMLKYCDILTVEAVDNQSVIVVQAQRQGDYNYVHKNDRWKDIEWALSTEFDRQCKVRLLSPGQSVPTAIPEASTRSTGMVGPSQPSAHLERPASSIDAEGPKARVQDGHLAYDASVVESLARTSIVSENKTTASPQETIEQKAMRDPIVQEVMKTFGAKIVNVQPK